MSADPMFTLAVGIALGLVVWMLATRGAAGSNADRLAIAVSLGCVAAIANLVIPIPNVELATVMVLCVSATFGISSGILVAVVAIGGSSLAGGVGPWTAWQIVGLTLVAVVAVGAARAAGSMIMQPVWLASVAVVATVLFDVVLTVSTLQLTGVGGGLSQGDAIRAALLLGIPFTAVHVLCNAVVAWVIGPMLMQVLRRAQQRTDPSPPRRGSVNS